MVVPRFILLVILVAIAMPVMAQTQPGLESSSKLPLPSASVSSLGLMTSAPARANELHSRLERPKAAESSMCYSLRNYRFARTKPDSDAMKLSGYSTCESASLFHLRENTASSK